MWGGGGGWIDRCPPVVCLFLLVRRGAGALTKPGPPALHGATYAHTTIKGTKGNVLRDFQTLFEIFLKSKMSSRSLFKTVKYFRKWR